MAGCKYACVCGNTCYNCSRYEPEDYPGEAEDLRAQQLGFYSYDDYLNYLEDRDRYY